MPVSCRNELTVGLTGDSDGRTYVTCGEVHHA